jgi:signal peptidase II
MLICVSNARSRRTNSRDRVDIVWLFAAVFITVFLLDRIIKIWIFNNLVLGMSYPVIENIFHITPIHNTGIAFGMLSGFDNLVFIFITIVIVSIVAGFLFFKKSSSVCLTMGLLLIFSGACGNLSDRLFYGYVMDFIDLRVWPVFNISDSAITIGASMVLFYMFKHKT